MATIQIKHVPEETHEVLRARARAAHQSLQEYLLAQLIDQASRPTLEEVLARIERRKGGGSAPMDLVVDLIRRDRAGR